MKVATATVRYLKMTPRKVGLIVDLVRGMAIQEAEAQLMVNPRRAAEPILKLLRSAKANAEVLDMDAEKLVISKIAVNPGPMMKRSLPRAFGRATPIQKKMSHVTVELTEDESSKAQRFAIPKRIKIAVGSDDPTKVSPESEENN